MSKLTFLGRLTLLQRWVLATVFAILPLLLAVGYAVFALQQQTDRQSQSMQRLDQMVSITNQLTDDIREQVRLARQYQLLRDDTLLALFRQKVATVRQTLGDLEDIGLTGEWRETVAALQRHSDGLESRLGLDVEFPAEGIALILESVMATSEELAESIDEARQDEIREGEQDFTRIIDRLFLITMLTLPGTFLLMILGTYLVSRPIWRLSQAIRRLGRQHWEKPITITGPADLVALADNLEWMRQQVRASDQQKTAFIQHVTHELKTPLAAIIEAANLMLDEVTGSLQGEQGKVLEILHSNALNLQQLIQQLINYNAVYHGIMIQPTSVNLMELCTARRHYLESAHPEKMLCWNIDGRPEEVVSDPRLLEMILANLLGNAFQFTPAGGTITVQWAPELSEGWSLTVSDTGLGIATDELERIFMPFYRGQGARGDGYPGNGIGLAIVKTCTDLLSGTVSVESTPGKGTRFTIIFPQWRKSEAP